MFVLVQSSKIAGFILQVIARGMHRGQKALFINEASLTGPLAASFAAVRSNISMDRAVRNINEKSEWPFTYCHLASPLGSALLAIQLSFACERL